MLNGDITDTRCPDCGDHMRLAEGQSYCIYCWEFRTSHFVHEAQRRLGEAHKKQLEALHETLLNDETQGYRFYADKAAIEGDWKSVLQFKWRAVVLETTGQRLAMQCAEAA